MKKFFLLLAVMSFAAVGVKAGRCDNATGELKGKHVLVFCGHGGGFVHKCIPASVEMMLKLGKEYGFRADSTSNLAVFNDKTLAGYDIIVYANASNLVLSAEQQSAFQKFIRRGGGFVGIHAATTTGTEWQWFTDLIGGVFAFHPPFQEFNVKVIDPSHPSTAVLKPKFRVKDELYIFKNLNPSIRVLAVSEFAGITSWGKNSAPDYFGNVMPSVWCNEFDGGRVWYTALGHDISCYSDPEYISHIVGGLKWTAAK